MVESAAIWRRGNLEVETARQKSVAESERSASSILCGHKGCFQKKPLLSLDILVSGTQLV